MGKMRQEFVNKLNIQLFAGKNVIGNQILSAGEQARYVNDINILLAEPTNDPLEEAFAKDTCSKADKSIFFGGKGVEAVERTNNFTANGLRAQDVDGVTGESLLYSVTVSPKHYHVPLWVDDLAFDKSQLGEESFLKDRQVGAIRNKSQIVLCELLKDLYTNKKRRVKDSNNAEYDLIIPNINVYGDPTLPFSDDKNIKLFRKLLRYVKLQTSNTSAKRYLVMGNDGGTEINDCTKFTSKDYNDFGGQNPNRTGDNPPIIDAQMAELLNYDKVFYPTGNETTGVMVFIVKGAIGKSHKTATMPPVIKHIEEKMAYFLNAGVSLSYELVIPEGVYFFVYKKDTTIGAGVSECSVDGGTPANNRGAVEPSKEDKILELLGKIDKDNEDIKATLNEHGITVNGPKVQVILGDQEPAEGENPPADEKPPKNGGKK